MSDSLSNKPVKVSQLEKLKRLRKIQEWILDDFSHRDIVAKGVAEWDVSERTVERYYSDAFKEFRERTRFDTEHLKAYYKSRKRKLIQDMDPVLKKTPAGVRAINKVLDSMAKIDGIVIDKVELSGPDGAPIATQTSIDMSNLTDDQLKALAALKRSLRNPS
ncbi:hypothetical protein [Pedobacter sp. SYP-B3415]|uniref:hypothetical protein n=1 Tax=Pedobacter sp. SYP-B3415 TaxID=2496641 RepID=UPI00101BC992|nr:hypothetical protein [Pedobacter sp. SYP-B3415]